MATTSDANQPMCNGAQSQQNPAQTNQQSAADPTSNQGSTGEVLAVQWPG